MDKKRREEWVMGDWLANDTRAELFKHAREETKEWKGKESKRQKNEKEKNQRDK